jgi:class I fructose-bisphosphate aldolase/fructose-bisphosphate aldolase/6-deoxy-5-ketofructose 1-phosphate synthase
MLMAGDQKVEHLNDDFVGDHVAVDDADPEHLFRIASRARIGAFATQLGLISRYAPDYRDVPYVVKLNAKTHLVPARSADPLSRQWHTIEQVVRLRDTAGLQIVGVAGLAACLGADFVKVNAPSAGPQSLREAVRAAGRTGVVCAGGGERGAEAFLRGLHAQLTEGGAAGSATGRNIHQRPLAEAVRLCNAITALDCDGASLDDALRILHGS